MGKDVDEVVIHPGIISPFLQLVYEDLGIKYRGTFFIDKIKISNHRDCTIQAAVEEEYSEAVTQAIRKVIAFSLPGLDRVKVETEPLAHCRSTQVERIITYIKNKYPSCQSCLDSLKLRLQAGKLILETSNGALLRYIEKQRLDELVIQMCKAQKIPQAIEFIAAENNQVMFNERKYNQPVEGEGERNDNEQDDYPVVLGRRLPEKPIAISRLFKSKGGVIEGRVFAGERRNTKRGGTIDIFELTDLSDSITIKVFDCPGTINKGDWYRIRGQVQEDDYSGEKVLMAEDIMGVPPRYRKDDCQDKRFELHVHTKMSDMNGLIGPNELAKTLSRWHHKGAAITDSGVVQAFPAVYQAFNEYGLKFIAGLEANLIPRQNPIYIGETDGDFHNMPLVFLDIETTGLSPWQHEVIEIGAVRWEGGNTQEFQTLVKPNVEPMPAILDLTGISPTELAGAPSLKDVWPDFIDFIKDALIIAHNCSFDLNFLRLRAEKIGEKFVTPLGAVDTLNLSRAINHEMRSHNLGALVKKFKVDLKDHHRALADAQATRKLWHIFTRELKKLKINDLEALRKLEAKIPWRLRFPNTITLLAANQEGLENLYRLVSKSHLEYFYRRPCITHELLAEYGKGLLMGTGSLEGPIYDMVLAGYPAESIRAVLASFDYVEVLPPYLITGATPVTEEDIAREITRYIIKLGEEENKLVVAVSDAHFIEPEEKIFRDILLHNGNAQARSAQCYLPTTGEMLDSFSFLGQAKAERLVIENAGLLQEKVEEVKPVPDGVYPPQMEEAETIIDNMTREKAHALYGDPLPDLIAKRIERELTSILERGYAPIYLISQLLVKKSNDMGYLVGSRGSVGSSLVAFLCGITEVNPLPPHYRCPQCRRVDFVVEAGSGIDLPAQQCPDCKKEHAKDGFDIPFEVFLGFRGEKVPDIDLNFAGDIQQTIHQYTEEIFGRENVFRAGTISTVAEKTAYGLVKNFLEEKNIKVNRAEIKRLVSGCTGVRRTTGQHPGGLMIVPDNMDIHKFTPVQYPANDSSMGVVTTHFDYRSISSRLLKLDLLGHDDPSLLKMLAAFTGKNIEEIPFDDEETLSIFSNAEALQLNESKGFKVGTLGIPEFGTPFVRGMLAETKPKSFSELVRISGLSHGTDVWLNNARNLITEGTADLEEVISTREDIMNNLIKWGLDTDTSFHIMEKVRKGKGLTKDEEAKIKEKQIPQWYIESCNKIKYMFPKAHAVAYVLMSVRIAFFKVHHPRAFYAAYFSTKANEFDIYLTLGGLKKVQVGKKEIIDKGNNITAKERATFIVLEVLEEALMRGVEFVPVDIYQSHINRFLLHDGWLLPPLICIPGLGINCALRIAEARETKKFTSIEDFVERTQTNKTVLEALQKLDVFGRLPQKNQLSLF